MAAHRRPSLACTLGATSPQGTAPLSAFLPGCAAAARLTRHLSYLRRGLIPVAANVPRGRRELGLPPVLLSETPLSSDRALLPDGRPEWGATLGSVALLDSRP